MTTTVDRHWTSTAAKITKRHKNNTRSPATTRTTKVEDEEEEITTKLATKRQTYEDSKINDVGLFPVGGHDAVVGRPILPFAVVSLSFRSVTLHFPSRFAHFLLFSISEPSYPTTPSLPGLFIAAPAVVVVDVVAVVVAAIFGTAVLAHPLVCFAKGGGRRCLRQRPRLQHREQVPPPTGRRLLRSTTSLRRCPPWRGVFYLAFSGVRAHGAMCWPTLYIRRFPTWPGHQQLPKLFTREPAIPSSTTSK